MTDTLSRKQRRLRYESADAQPIEPAQAGQRTSLFRASRRRLSKRVGYALGAKKEAESEARYLRAVAGAAFAVLESHPVLLAQARVAAFVAAMESLAVEDSALAAALATVTPNIAPEAAAVVMADLDAGPRVVAALAKDSQLAARVAALPATAQAVELGKLLAQLQPAQPRPESILGLFISERA